MSGGLGSAPEVHRSEIGARRDAAMRLDGANRTMSTITAVEPEGESRDLELRDYLQVVRRRKWAIVVTTVLVVLAALAFSYLQKTIYRSTAEVLLQPRASEQLFQLDQQQPQNVTPDTTRVATEIQVMESRSVQDAVTQALGNKADVE